MTPGRRRTSVHITRRPEYLTCNEVGLVSADHDTDYDRMDADLRMELVLGRVGVACLPLYLATGISLEGVNREGVSALGLTAWKM